MSKKAPVAEKQEAPAEEAPVKPGKHQYEWVLMYGDVPLVPEPYADLVPVDEILKAGIDLKARQPAFLQGWKWTGVIVGLPVAMGLLWFLFLALGLHPMGALILGGPPGIPAGAFGGYFLAGPYVARLIGPWWFGVPWYGRPYWCVRKYLENGQEKVGPLEAVPTQQSKPASLNGHSNGHKPALIDKPAVVFRASYFAQAISMLDERDEFRSGKSNWLRTAQIGSLVTLSLAMPVILLFFIMGTANNY